MDMKSYIEKAEKKAGSQIELAKMLSISANNIRSIKAGKRGMPVDACIILADYIDEDRLEVIAASNLVTKKDERKRKIIESCFKEVASVASIAIVTSILTLSEAKPVNTGDLTYHIEKNTNYTQFNRRKNG